MTPQDLDEAAAECAAVASAQSATKLAESYANLAQKLRAIAVEIRRKQFKIVS